MENKLDLTKLISLPNPIVASNFNSDFPSTELLVGVEVEVDSYKLMRLSYLVPTETESDLESFIRGLLAQLKTSHRVEWYTQDGKDVASFDTFKDVSYCGYKYSSFADTSGSVFLTVVLLLSASL